MFFLGIDIGKYSHVASLIDDKKKVIFKAFSFSNSNEGANSLIKKLEPFCDSLDIAMEATGHYWIIPSSKRLLCSSYQSNPN